MKKRRIKIKWVVYLTIAILVVLINIVAWNSTAFCDWYIAHIFPIWVNTYGRFSGMFPFSLGEILLMLGVLVLAVAVIWAPVLGICMLIPAYRKRKEKRLMKAAGVFYKSFAWILLGVCLVMTLNCTILYHGSTFNEKYFGMVDREYSLEELVAVLNFVVERCN